MRIPSSGPIRLSDLKNTFGGDNDPSLSEYYKDRVNLSGVPIRGNPISFGSFRGIGVDTLAEVITQTSNVSWTLKFANARKLHVYVIGAGGSGGVANAGSGFTDGAAAAAGGGGGGVAFVEFPRGYIPSSAIIRAGTGGQSFSHSGENTGKAGFAGTQSYFASGGYIITANGGDGGGAAWWRSGGNDVASTEGLSGSSGGSAFSLNTNIPNAIQGSFSGGNGGKPVASGRGVRQAAGGGGAPAFLAAHDNINDGGKGDNSQGPGAKVSDYLSFPFILETYLSNQGFSTIRNLYSFNGSDGVFSTSGNSPGYGGGSGGVVWSNGGTVTSAAGGNGIVIIVYEL